MTFHMDILKDCLGRWIHLRICQALLRQTKPMSERQLAGLLEIPTTTLHRILKKIGRTGLIKSQKVGNASYWRLEQKGYLFETLKPVFDGLTSMTPPLLYLKKLILKTLHISKKYRLILFGSTINGTDTPSSDIDLCIVYPAESRKQDRHLEEDLERLQEASLEKFGKILNPVFIEDSTLAKRADTELHRNILKGMELTT